MKEIDYDLKDEERMKAGHHEKIDKDVRPTV